LPTGNAAAAKPKKKRAEEEEEAESTDEDGDPYEGMNKEKVFICTGSMASGCRLQTCSGLRENLSYILCKTGHFCYAFLGNDF
jgi:hypothetical protein